jgi:hypothetical protein
MDKINTKHSNYTTPEQSLRLIELGVPASSSDCYYTSSGKIEVKNTALDTLYPACWSVGELMRIYAICFDPDVIEFDIFADGTTFIQQMIDKFEIWIDAMDFSKLEK